MNRATVVLILLFLVGVSSYLWWQQRNTVTAPTPTIQPDSTNTVEPPTDSPDQAALQEVGTTYQDPQGIFSVTYPPDYELDQPAEGQVRLIKRGEMQRPQSEISDGVLLVFETLTLEGKTLQEVVDQRITDFTANQIGEIIQPKTAVTIEGYPGFAYTIRSLGTSRQILLQKDSDSEYAIAIGILIEDPQDAGYEQHVDAILSSMEFMK